MYFKAIQRIALLGIFICKCSLGFGQSILNEVTVTAQKQAQKSMLSGKVVTVLGDSILSRFASQSVAEVLNKQAGIVVVGANNSPGSNQEMYLRGASTGNTLVLIDGIPVYDPSYIATSFDLNFLNINQIERIEILKGGHGTLYGSDAVAAVIQIFTKKPLNKEKSKSGQLNLSTGSFDTYQGNLVLNHVINQKLTTMANLGFQSSKGFSAANDPKGNQGYDKDGQKQINAGFSINYKANDSNIFNFKGLANFYANDLDAGAFADEKDFTAINLFSQLSASWIKSYKKGSLNVNYAFGVSAREFKDDSLKVEPNAFNKYSFARYGGVNHFIDIFNNLTLSESLKLIVGVDFRNANTYQTYESISDFGKYESPEIKSDLAHSNILGIYANAVFQPKNSGFTLDFGSRYNKHSFYGDNLAYGFHPSYLWTKSVKVFSNISSGFKAPSLYQLFSPYGNKNLKPETSQNMELGLQWFNKQKVEDWRFAFFKRNIKDLIFFQSTFAEPFGQYINFNQQHDKGFEIEGNTTLGKLRLFANGTYLTGNTVTQVAGKDSTFFNLYRRPKYMVNASIGYTFSPQLSVQISSKYVGKRKDQFFNNNTFATEQVELKAYQTIDLYAEYKLSTKHKVYLDCRNVTNATYQDSYGYNTRPINVMVGFNLGF